LIYLPPDGISHADLVHACFHLLMFLPYLEYYT